MSTTNNAPNILSAESKGKRTLMETLDRLAKTKPEEVYCWIPIDDDLSNGFHGVNNSEIVRAIDSCAWWIKSNYGTSDSFETLAYMGTQSDLRYTIFFYASVKCGYKCLTPSPANAMVQNIRLLQLSNCTKIFYASEVRPIVQQLQSNVSTLQAYPLERLDHWTETHTKSYPFTKNFEESKWDPILVLHSSGTTGPPKLIVMNHGYMSRTDLRAPGPPGQTAGNLDLFDHGNYFAPFPASHLAGFMALSYYPVFNQNSAFVLLPPAAVPTPQLVRDVLQRIEIHTLYIPPSLLEGVAHLEGGMDLLSKLSTIVYAGGPLSPSIGSQLTAHVAVNTVYGSTETSGCLVIHSKRGSPDWQYLNFHPAFNAIFEPSIDGASELVYRKAAQEDIEKGKVPPDYDRYWGVFWTQPDKTEFRTHDLFKPHPDPAKKNMWRFYGRTDDTIILRSGRKFNPVAAEATISSCPLLTGAMIVGEGRDEKAVLVEPKEEVGSSETEKRRFSNEIWEWVEKANEEMMTDKVISKSRVMVVEKGGFVRAPKGTVVRKSTAEKYRKVVDEMYGDSMDIDHINWHGE